MLISPKTQKLDYNQDMNDLLCQIDSFLAKKAKLRLDSQRFGFYTSIDYDDYDLLVTYRELLLDKAKYQCCLGEFQMDEIISRIKQLLNRN